MINYQPDNKRIVFLFSDTGGGHRSAAEAIIEAINLEYPGKVTCEMVDVFRKYSPSPLKFAPEIYPPLTRVPDIWAMSYRISDDKLRMRFFYRTVWPYVRRYVHRLIIENPCDLIVSVHPLVNSPVLRALGDCPIPYSIVVTDLVSIHVAWFQDKADLIIVPTEPGYQRALLNGIQPDKLKLVGQPVAEKFCQPTGNVQQLREELDWPLDLPVILLVGGGDGMGPLEEVARAINSRKFKATLVVVTGRNRKLKETLENLPWNMPVFVYGFVREMPAFMRAADILVTKAGPGTISEAFIAELPMILYSRLPGQEVGNVDYVINEGAGVWAPDPEKVANTIKYWLDYPDQRQIVKQNCKRLARPLASRQIAHELANLIGLNKQD